ncbi:hypothetical protein GCM10027053_06990 [Intrasporangium mesophilum]
MEVASRIATHEVENLESAKEPEGGRRGQPDGPSTLGQARRRRLAHVGEQPERTLDRTGG